MASGGVPVPSGGVAGAGGALLGMGGTRPPDASPPDPGAVDTRVDSAEWQSYGHDLFNTRNNPTETKVGVSNVATLAQRWAWTKSAVTSTPAYYGGFVYFVDGENKVVALDASTGSERWRTLLPKQLTQGQLGSQTVTEDAVYAGGDNSMLVRLDRKTGSVVWAVQVDEEGGAKRIYDSPAVVGDLVIAGVASWQNINPIGNAIQPFRGSLVARRKDTGAPVWRVVLTEATGVGITSSVAIDPSRKSAFIGTGQNYTGDSPYADSVVAIDYAAGKISWHNQFTSADVFSLDRSDGCDCDVLASPVLYTVDGVDMVAAGDKGGTFRAFERDGKPRWSVRLTPGGHHGGVMGSSAYADGTLFVCSGDFTTDQTLGVGQDGPSSSLLLALNGADGSTRWTQPIEGTCYAAVTHANGVVYLPTGKGELRLFDARNGTPLGSLPLGGSSAGGASVVNGTVYVSYGWDWILPPAGGVVAFGLP
jgi:polyvinyl alcohol dehydrogenase (cytochrome)